MWDLSLFIGSPCVSSVGSVFLAILLGLNVVVQSIFLYSLIHPDLKLTSPDYPPAMIENLRLWRLTEAHNYKYWSLFKGEVSQPPPSISPVKVP